MKAAYTNVWNGSQYDETQRQAVIVAWGDAERRIGKFVNLDRETLDALVTSPPELLVESVRSRLGAM